MAKIRGIKPEFWTDEDVVEVSIPARILFIGMWNYACDNGHLEDKPKQIKMRIFPADNIDVEPLLAELAGVGLIHREQGIITIPTLGKHQRIDRRYFTVCGLPHCEPPTTKSAPPSGRTTGARRETPPRAPSTHVDGDSDGEGDGEGELTPGAIRENFEDFYATYPRKMKRADALKAFTAAVKRGVDPEVILQGAQQLAADPNLPTDRNFIPYPATWLRAEGWEDEPLPPRRSGGYQNHNDRLQAMRAASQQATARLGGTPGGLLEGPAA